MARLRLSLSASKSAAIKAAATKRVSSTLIRLLMKRPGKSPRARVVVLRRFAFRAAQSLLDDIGLSPSVTVFVRW